MEWLTTTTMLASLRDYQDAGAWERFAARFRRPIFSFARSAGLSDSDAEDVAQESLLGFAEALRRGLYDRNKGRLRSWLFGIAYRQILRLREKDARHANHRAEVESSTFWRELAQPDQAEALWQRQWEEWLWQQCLERVRPEFQPVTLEAFQLVVRDGLPPQEVAGRLGVSVRSVYNAKHRVLRRLRELYRQMDDAE